MILTRITHLLFFTLIVLNLNAQKVECTIGVPYKYSGKTFHTKYLTKTENSIVLLRQNYKNNVFYIDYYDFEMKLKGSREINYSQNELKILDISFAKDEFIILSTHYNKQSNVFLLFGSTGTFEDIQHAKPQKLGEFPSNKLKDIKIQTRYSEDKTQLMITCTYPTVERLAKLNYYVFDLNLNQQDFAEVELPLKIADFELVQSGISNQGDLHFVTRKKIERTYKFEFISFFRNDGSMSEKELTFEKNIPKYVRLLVTDKKVNVIAVLSDINQRILTSTYFLNLDCIERTYSNATYEDLTQALSKSTEGRSYSYYLHTVLQSDGTIFLTLEYMNVRDYTSYDSFGTPHTTYYYDYNDLVIIALDEQGSKKWGYVIPKNQTSINDRGYGLGSGFLALNGQLLITFNTNIKNTSQAEQYRMNNVRKSILVGYLFDKDGQISRQVLANSKQAGLIFEPKINFNSGNSIILPGNKGNLTSFAQIKF